MDLDLATSTRAMTILATTITTTSGASRATSEIWETATIHRQGRSLCGAPILITEFAEREGALAN